jgi:hypothetical protein
MELEKQCDVTVGITGNFENQQAETLKIIEDGTCWIELI